MNESKEEFLRKSKKYNEWINESHGRIEEINNYGFLRKIFYMREMDILISKVSRVISLQEQRVATFVLMQRLTGEQNET